MRITKEMLHLRASLNSAAREANYTAATGVGELLLEWEPTGCGTRRLDPRLLWPSEKRMYGNPIDQLTHS